MIPSPHRPWVIERLVEQGHKPARGVRCHQDGLRPIAGDRCDFDCVVDTLNPLDVGNHLTIPVAAVLRGLRCGVLDRSRSRSAITSRHSASLREGPQKTSSCRVLNPRGPACAIPSKSPVGLRTREFSSNSVAGRGAASLLRRIATATGDDPCDSGVAFFFRSARGGPETAAGTRHMVRPPSLPLTR